MDGPGPDPAWPEPENGWANGSSPCRPGLPGQGTVGPVAGAPATLPPPAASSGDLRASRFPVGARFDSPIAQLDLRSGVRRLAALSGDESYSTGREDPTTIGWNGRASDGGPPIGWEGAPPRMCVGTGADRSWRSCPHPPVALRLRWNMAAPCRIFGNSIVVLSKISSARSHGENRSWPVGGPMVRRRVDCRCAPCDGTGFLVLWAQFNVLATRNPRLAARSLRSAPQRYAELTCSDEFSHEPPRNIRFPQSPS